MGLHHETFTARLYQHVRPFVRLHSHASHFCTRDAYDLCRLDYLLISHFLLNLQDISTVTSNGSDPSDPSLGRSDQGQVSSIRFASSIIGNLGAPLRDGPLEDDEEIDNIDAEGVETSCLSRNNEELYVGSSLQAVSIVEENVAGPSRTPSCL